MHFFLDILPEEPYLTDIDVADWDKVIAAETEWKKAHNFS